MHSVQYSVHVSLADGMRTLLLRIDENGHIGFFELVRECMVFFMTSFKWMLSPTCTGDGVS